MKRNKKGNVRVILIRSPVKRKEEERHSPMTYSCWSSTHERPVLVQLATTLAYSGYKLLRDKLYTYINMCFRHQQYFQKYQFCVFIHSLKTFCYAHFFITFQFIQADLPELPANSLISNTEGTQSSLIFLLLTGVYKRNGNLIFMLEHMWGYMKKS